MLSAAVDADGEMVAGSSLDAVPWWSFSKTLIAACALIMTDAQRLSLDEPLDGLPYSLRCLLQHRAGVGDYGGDAAYHAAVARGDRPWSDAELLARFAPERLRFAPWRGWAYSNVGYLLVRRAIERADDSGLAEVLQRRVVAPLGLQRSRVAERPADMAATAFAGGRDYQPGWAFHGFVVGPVAEAALALPRLPDLLGPAAWAAMLDRHAIGGPVPGRPWRTAGYGLGLMIGAMGREGAPALAAAGHSAGGPGSVGAVYRRMEGRARTAAAFAAGSDEGVAEDAAYARLLED